MPVLGPRNECTVHVPESQLLKGLLSTCQMGHCALVHNVNLGSTKRKIALSQLSGLLKHASQTCRCNTKKTCTHEELTLQCRCTLDAVLTMMKSQSSM